MNLHSKFLTNNTCYKTGKKITVKGLMLHSVGCSQPRAGVFVDIWNKPGVNACVHAFIDAETGDVVQTLPWNHRGWHAGGAANNTHIGVEMCEPKDIKYLSGSTFNVLDPAKAHRAVDITYRSAVELFAFLCSEFNLDPLEDGVIISHKEGHERGIASNHGDPEHLWKQTGTPYSMDTFRKDVYKFMNKRFNNFEELPEWAKPTIKKLMDKGYLTALDLSLDMIRVFVVNDRAGLYA